MSKKQLVFLLLCLCLNSWAQGVKKYEYWFDQQAESRQTGTAESGHVQLNLDVSQLAVGLHTLAFRAQDEGGSWSAPATSYFIRTEGHQTNNRISKYQYWIDSQTAQAVTAATDGTVSLNIDVASLSKGLHSLTFRAQDEWGQWSTPSTSYFLRTEEHQSKNSISKYQYWIDSQTTQAVTAATDGIVSLDIDVAALPLGLHSLTFRAQDEWGQWSAPSTSYFLRVNPRTQNVLARYEYWFDGNTTERQSINTADGIIELSLDVSALSYGVHALTFRMADSRGSWSAPSTSYFVKPRLTASPNLIAGYQYWFNEAGSQATYVALNEPASPAVIDVQLPVNNLKTKVTPQNIAVINNEDGSQTIALKNALHSRFKDLNGQWSIVQTDSFTVVMDNEELDMTAFIVNPDATDGRNGWSTGAGSWSVRQNDHYSGQSDNYFHLNGNTIMRQRISGLPAGSYTLVLMARAASGSEGEIRANGYSTDIGGTDWSQYVLTFVTNGSPFDLELANNSGSGYVDADDLILMTAVERQSIAMTVTDGEGNDVTQQVTIRWYDAEDKLMGTGNSISGVKKGGEMSYSIELGEELGRIYREVNHRSFKANSSRITCQLDYIGETMLTAHVVDADSQFDLSGANISVTQWLNGKYTQHFTTQTDRQGMFSLQVAADSTVVTVNSDGYVEQRIGIAQDADSNLGTIALSEATGLMLIPELAYQPAVEEGTEPEVQNWYADQGNVSYGVRNLTRQTDLQASVQRGIIIVPDGYADGDRLRVTASSRNGQFATTSCEVQVGQQNDTISVPLLLVECGAIEVTYGGKGDDESLAMVYNSQGRMVLRTTFSTARTVFEGLTADTYRLITMGYDGTMGTVTNLNDMQALGLQDGIDYVSNTVTVRDGFISSLTVDSVPEMDRSKFSYTSVNTSYLPNKSQFVAGNFVTLTSRVDFKTQYQGNVSNILVSFDIPEGCEFIDNSVVIGTRQVPYALSNDKLTVAIAPEDVDSRIRFCLTPTHSGTFTSSAYAAFTCNGEKTQTIGSAYFEATDMAIAAPSSTRKTQVPVSGVATPQAQVDVYDNGTLIGSTQALADGRWSVDCELYKPYNLSSHEINAKVRQANGIIVTTASKECYFDINAVEAKSVLMTFYNGWMQKNINVTFDFEAGTTSSNNYSFYTATDFTFVADLTANDTTSVRGVTFYVYTSQNEVRELEGFFDKNQSRWVAVSHFDSYNLPVNLMVDVEAQPKTVFDNNIVINAEKEQREGIKAYKEFAEMIDELYLQVLTITVDSEENQQKADALIQSMLQAAGLSVASYQGEPLPANREALTTQLQEIDSLIHEINSDSFDEKLLDISEYQDFTMGDYHVSRSDFSSLSDTELSDFTQYQTLSGSWVYVKADENKFVYADKENDYVLTAVKAGEDPARVKFKEGSESIEELLWWSQKITEVGVQLETAARPFTDLIAKALGNVNRLTAEISRLEASKAGYEAMDMMAEYTTKHAQLAKELSKASKYLSWLNGLKKALPILNAIQAVVQLSKDESTIVSIFRSIPTPCPNDQERASKLKRDVVAYGIGVGTYAVLQGGLIYTSLANLPSLVVSGPVGVAVEIALIGSQIAAAWAYDHGMPVVFSDLRNRAKGLQCKKPDPDPDPTPNPGGGGGNGSGGSSGGGNGNGGNGGGFHWQIPPFSPLVPIHDPSGFVYEAVPTNRLQDVTATIYYDEEEPKLWDAKNYSQVNPIVTGEAGLYAWDVPQGMWQVRFEKSGYETAQTDWLPVPPPQMEINIPLQQAVAPIVEKARGTESGIWLTFSKYMIPETLTKNSRITVSRNGSNAKGDVELLNLEEDPYNKKEYASRVKFVPNTAFKTTDEVIVTVKKEVESYADKQMAEDFVQRVVIEPELKAIVCDSLIAVDYKNEAIVEVSVLPAEAAKGKTLMVESTSPIIASADAASVKLDSDGKARLVVSGNLPGSASLRLSMPEAELQRMAEVSVVLAETTVRMPKASKRTGSMVEPGYLLELSCATKGATIYYTLDGSCPCNEQTRKLYTGSFALPLGEVTVKAMATREGMDDSDVATFIYNVSELAAIAPVEAEYNDLTARYEHGTITVTGAEGCTVRVYDLLGHELAYSLRAPRRLELRVPKAEGYIVAATAADGKTVVRKVVGQ